MPPSQEPGSDPLTAAPFPHSCRGLPIRGESEPFTLAEPKRVVKTKSTRDSKDLMRQLELL